MKPLLSITIPTYNRPDSLKKLNTNFLSRVVGRSNGGVEVIVCDNSDLKQAEKNRVNLKKSNVQYRKNSKNLGFSGNILRCLQEAKGEFLWIISDDDEVDIDDFFQFFTWLKNQNSYNFSAVMLPFKNEGDKYHTRQLMNTSEEWKSESGIKLVTMIKKTSNIPFVLFSSVVLKNTYSLKNDELLNLQAQYTENDYIQIPLFIRLIESDGIIKFYDRSLQRYKRPRYVRFSMLQMVESLERSLEYTADYLNLSTEEYDCIYQKCHYRRWMRWLVQDRAGLCEVNEAKRARWVLLRKWWFMHLNNITNIKLFILNILPLFILNKVYKKF